MLIVYNMFQIPTVLVIFSMICLVVMIVLAVYAGNSNFALICTAQQDSSLLSLAGLYGKTSQMVE